jgi:hypothetical protein
MELVRECRQLGTANPLVPIRTKPEILRCADLLEAQLRSIREAILLRPLMGQIEHTEYILRLLGVQPK